jgi:HSP20 family protein
MPVFRIRQTWEPLHDLERHVDRLLENFPFPFPTIRFERQYPPINVYETNNEYLLTAELPGVTGESLELSVSGGVLTLRGSRLPPSGVADDQFRRHERVWGQWERMVQVPDRIREDLVTAELNHGILKVHLPKADEAKSRQIQVVQNHGE